MRSIRTFVIFSTALSLIITALFFFKSPFNVVGIVSPLSFAEIKPQISGNIIETHFEEGQTVKEGDLLFVIDPKPYEISLEQAVAKRAQMISKLQYAAEKVSRYESLLSHNYVKEVDFIHYTSELKHTEALLMECDAEIRLAKMDLDHCYIKAPITGVIGKHLHENSALATIYQIDPIYIEFAISEKVYAKIGPSPLLKISEELIAPKVIPHSPSGKIILRAEVPNLKKLLWPGMHIKAQLQSNSDRL